MAGSGDKALVTRLPIVLTFKLVVPGIKVNAPNGLVVDIIE